jgi:hypothetical protein
MKKMKNEQRQKINLIEDRKNINQEKGEEGRTGD